MEMYITHTVGSASKYIHSFHQQCSWLVCAAIFDRTSFTHFANNGKHFMSSPSSLDLTGISTARDQ